MEAELAKALQSTQSALAVSPEYQLDSYHIFEIGQVIGPLVDRQGELNLGQRRRIRLLIITCAKILPLWEFHWPRSLLPHQLLAHMAAYLIHTATLAQVKQSADRLLSWLETHSADPFEHSGHGVGLVAYKAYETLETVVGQGMTIVRQKHTLEYVLGLPRIRQRLFTHSRSKKILSVVEIFGNGG
jgi:hypothetical protein